MISGYHGTVSIINMEDNLVSEMVTVSRKEEANSWIHEEKGARKALESLQDRGIHIVEVVHDDNTIVDAIIEKMRILNQKDMWHKAKNMVQKFVDKLVKATFTVEVDIDVATSRCEIHFSLTSMFLVYNTNLLYCAYICLDMLEGQSSSIFVCILQITIAGSHCQAVD